MFGGLEIKGEPIKDGDDDHTSETAARTTHSSFSFMNETLSEQPTTVSAAPEVSSFSFLNPAPLPATAPQDSELDKESLGSATTSGFSFIGQELSNDLVEQPTVDPALDDASIANDTALLSGFGFINPPELESTIEETKQTIPEETLASAPSGFSFLSGENSVPTPESSLASEKATTMTAASNGLPAGTGITFGTSAKRNVIKKKKMRSSKIGMASNQVDSHAASLHSVTTPAVVVETPALTSDVTEKQSSRNDALAATHRAEAFMQSKASDSQLKDSISSELKPVASSTDEVMVAAKAAAEEAKILQQNHKGGGFMGTFFKGFRTGSNATTHKRDSSHGSIGSDSNHTNLSDLGNNNTDRLPEEQEEVTKNTRAEFQQQQQQQQQLKAHSLKENNNDQVKAQLTASDAIHNPDPVTIGSTVDVTPETKIYNSSSVVKLTIPNDERVSHSVSFKKINTTVPSIFSSPKLDPKRKKTSKELFGECQDFFAQSVEGATMQIKDTTNEQKMLSENRFLALAKDCLATQQISQIEQQLQNAIDKEDYEQADQLGEELEGHKREKDEVAHMLQNINESLTQLESRKAQLGDNVAGCFENLAVRLEELNKEEAANERKDDDETLNQFANISKQLSTEQERLQQYSKHLEREEEHVCEERKELEGSIKEQTCEIETMKDDTCTNLKKAENEIDELRKTLDRKLKEAANLRTTMFGFEDSISKVRVKFSRQLARVDKKEREVKESRYEWKSEHELHKKQKEAHELQVQSHSDTLLSHEELITTLKSELHVCKEFSKIIPVQIQFINEANQANQLDSEVEEELAQLQADVVKCEGAVANAKKSLKLATEAIRTLQNEHDRLLSKVPELEKEKKSAAAARDFKAAGKSSKQIKEAKSRLESIEDELNGDVDVKRASAEIVLHRLDSELSKARKIAEAKERLSGEKRMIALAKLIAQLVEKEKVNCGEVTSENNDVKSVSANFLESQILMLKTQGQQLGSKYGVWEKLMEKIEIDEVKLCDFEERQQHFTDSSRCKGEKNKTNCESTSEERLIKVRDLLKKINVAEGKVEEAAAKEDFDQAVEFQEVSDTLQVQLSKLNVTDEELELALSIEETADEIALVVDADDDNIKEDVSETTENENKHLNNSDLNQNDEDSHSADFKNEEENDEENHRKVDAEDDNIKENVLETTENENKHLNNSDLNQKDEDSHSAEFKNDEENDEENHRKVRNIKDDSRNGDDRTVNDAEDEKNESDSSNLNEEQAEGKEKLQEIKNEDVECKDDSEEPLDEEEQS